MDVIEREVYEGLIIATLIASAKKVKAGLRYAASAEYQDYPEGVIEVGAALDAIDMVAKDVLYCIEANADEQIVVGG